MAEGNKAYGITSSVRAGMEQPECSPSSGDSVTWYKMARKLSGSFHKSWAYARPMLHQAYPQLHTSAHPPKIDVCMWTCRIASVMSDCLQPPRLLCMYTFKGLARAMHTYIHLKTATRPLSAALLINKPQKEINQRPTNGGWISKSQFSHIMDYSTAMQMI